MLDVRSRRVLVVEDDYFIASEMRRALEGAGADVLGPVGRVTDALALIEGTDRIDCAVLDVNLHGTGVDEVADALRRRSVPFVFATGYERADIPSRFGDVRCYEKPVPLRAVVDALVG